ncbi:MAG: lysoplasmalogenase [Eubacteriales bacterium]|jgi:uncharacterized membrane protein YhhN
MTFNLPGGLCLALYLALSVWDCALQETNCRDFFVKPLLMPLLMLVYVFLSKNAPPDCRVLLALAFGCLGDTLLLWEHSLKICTFGAAAFWFGHICYILAFLHDARRSENGFMTAASRTLVLLVAALCFAVALAIAARRLVPHFPEKLRTGFFVYSGTIIAMSLSALFRFLSVGTAGAGISFAGSLLFILSDTLIACRVAFHRKMKGVMETYLPAQLLIMLGFLI